MCTAQRRREQTNGLLEGRIEAGDATEHRVSQQLDRGRPGGRTQRQNGHDSKVVNL